MSLAIFKTHLKEANNYQRIKAKLIIHQLMCKLLGKLSKLIKKNKLK